MITIHRKLIHAKHGYQIFQLPAGSKILSVGPQGNQMIPVFVQVEDTETVLHNLNLYVTMTNLRHAEEEATFLGTCVLEQNQAAHVFLLS